MHFVGFCLGGQALECTARNLPEFDSCLVCWDSHGVLVVLTAHQESFFRRTIKLGSSFDVDDDGLGEEDDAFVELTGEVLG